MEGTHYDCHAEHFKGEAFYGYSNEMRLLTAILEWRCMAHLTHPNCIMHAVTFSVTEDGDELTHGAVVLWSA